jgi:hypothetical protein
MECKLSEQNTKLLKEVEALKLAVRDERDMYDKVRTSEAEWHDYYEKIIFNLINGNTHVNKGYIHFQNAMNTFIRDYCKIKGCKVPQLYIDACRDCEELECKTRHKHECPKGKI